MIDNDSAVLKINKTYGKEPDKVVDLLEKFEVSEAEAEMMADPVFIIDGLIVAGHLILIVAEPNGGKTTIFFHLSEEIAEKGYKVIYVNADISAGDSKELIKRANNAGVKLLLPDLKAGMSMNDVVQALEEINRTGGDLSQYVFVFDTLKKMADLINKSSAKRLLSLLRGMTGKGATIILLAHTNKYKTQDGKLIFEGTADLRSDVDELMYLYPEKHSDGSMTVSVEPDKTRATIDQMTFSISRERLVTRLEEYQDISKKREERDQFIMDKKIIERISEAIQIGKIKQCEIVDHCHVHGISKRRGLTCLNRYTDRLWTSERGSQME